jgi:hypothetical protein
MKQEEKKLCCFSARATRRETAVTEELIFQYGSSLATDYIRTCYSFPNNFLDDDDFPSSLPCSQTGARRPSALEILREVELE